MYRYSIGRIEDEENIEREYEIDKVDEEKRKENNNKKMRNEMAID